MKIRDSGKVNLSGSETLRNYNEFGKVNLSGLEILRNYNEFGKVNLRGLETVQNYNWNLPVIKMETVLCDERDERFIYLSNELDNEYFANIGEDALKYREYTNTEDPHIVLLLLNWGNPIACAAYRILDSESIEIRRVFVKRRYRRKNIAYKLVKALEKLAIENNFRYSYLETGVDNTAAINLYKKLGYEKTDNFGFFKDDDLCICMKKEFKSLIF